MEGPHGLLHKQLQMNVLTKPVDAGVQQQFCMALMFVAPDYKHRLPCETHLVEEVGIKLRRQLRIFLQRSLHSFLHEKAGAQPLLCFSDPPRVVITGGMAVIVAAFFVVQPTCSAALSSSSSSSCSCKRC